MLFILHTFGNAFHLMIRLHLFILLAFLLLFSSCKKDLIAPANVRRLNSHVSTHLNSVAFLNDSVCVIGGGSTFYESTVLRSIDGGYSWAADSIPQAPKEFYGMNITPNGNIYLSGIDGLVAVSDDEGNSWQVNRVGSWLVNKGGAFVTPDTGIFVSTVLQRQCTITRVDADFNIIDEQTHLFGLNNVYFTDPNTAYIVGYGAVMKTTNKGNTWSFLNVDGDNFSAMDIHGDEIWMCGTNGGIFYSADAGKHWERRRNGNNIALPRYMLRCLLFTDSRNGWAAGDDGKLLLTKDGGYNWMEYKAFATGSIRAITRCPNNDLLLVGDNGTIFRITP